MKINEKNLCMFACTPPVDLEGYLNKKGEINKSWQKRWFVLKGNLLFYFEKKSDKEPIGMIILEGCTIELAEEGEQYCFQIIFHGPNNRTYLLSADSQTTMEQWMKSLTCAGYDYMKLMVGELQRQLDEIEGSKDKTPENTPAPKPPPRRQNPFNRPAPTTVPQNSPASSTASINNALLTQQQQQVPSNLLTSSVTSGYGGSSSALTATPTSVSSVSSTNATKYNNNINLLMQDCNIDNRANDITFEKIHDKLGKPILKEINDKKLYESKKNEPLILF